MSRLVCDDATARVESPGPAVVPGKDGFGWLRVGSQTGVLRCGLGGLGTARRCLFKAASRPDGTA
jgi:hypothetical protein